MMPKLTANLSIDVFAPTDLPDVLNLLQRGLPADPISELEFERKILIDPNFRKSGALVARFGRRIVGFILGIKRVHLLEDGSSDLDRGYITLLAVDSGFRRMGVGTALLHRVLTYLKDEGAKSVWVSPYAPNYFTPGIDEIAYPEAREFFRFHGFEVAYRPLSMETLLPVQAIEKERTPLIGVRVQGFTPELILPVTDFVRQEFPGDWQRLVRMRIQRILGGISRPDELIAAMDGDLCVGFCAHDGERFGPFGVSKSARGKGIGGALLHACLSGMYDAGLRRAWFAWTDDRAARLYARFGFRETRRFSVMKVDI